MIKKLSNKKYKTKYVGYDKKNGTKHKNNKTLIKRRIYKICRKTTYKLRGGRDAIYNEINKCLLDVKQVNDLYVYSDELYKTAKTHKANCYTFDKKFINDFNTNTDRLENSHKSVKEKSLYTKHKDLLAVFETNVTAKLIKTILAILENDANINENDKIILKEQNTEILTHGIDKEIINKHATILSNLAIIIYNNFIQNQNTREKNTREKHTQEKNTQEQNTRSQTAADFRIKLKDALRQHTPIIPYPRFSFFGNSQTEKALFDYLIEYTIFKCITIKLVSFFISKIYDPIKQYTTKDTNEVFTFTLNTKTYVIIFNTLSNQISIYTLNKNTDIDVLKCLNPSYKIPRYDMCNTNAFNMLSSYTDVAYCDIKYITIYNSGWSGAYYLTCAIANAINNTESKDAYTVNYDISIDTDQQNTNNTIYYFDNVIESDSNKKKVSQYNKPEYTEIGDALFSVSITLYDTLKLENIWKANYITVYSTGYKSMYDTKTKKMIFSNANNYDHSRVEEVPKDLGFPVKCISRTALQLNLALSTRFPIGSNGTGTSNA